MGGVDEGPELRSLKEVLRGATISAAGSMLYIDFEGCAPSDVEKAFDALSDMAESPSEPSGERPDYKHTAYGGYVDEAGALKIGEIPEGER